MSNEQRELQKDELYDQFIQATEKLSVEELRQLLNIAQNFRRVKSILVFNDHDA